MNIRILSIVPIIVSFALLSCASSNQGKSGNIGVIEYTKSEYINILSLDAITAGFQRLKPTYTITSEAGFTKFSYNFEMNNSSKIIDSYRSYCSSKGGNYLSSDWTVGLCSKTNTARDSLFFVKLKPSDGFGPSFKYVNLWVLEPTGTSPSGYENFIRTSGYLTSEQLKDNQKTGMAISEAQRVNSYLRTVGSKVCKRNSQPSVSGFVESVGIDQIQIRLQNNNLTWEIPSDWMPCQ